MQKVLRKARKGTQVFYVPGNHDEAARHYVGVDFGGVAIREEATHVTSRGRRLLVTHGDLFDAVVTGAKWLALLGDRLYTLTLKLNQHFNALRARIGLPYWSLSQFLKFKVKNAVSYITAFEEALAREARTRGFDGVVCGHIHHAEIRNIGGVLYCNSGDWVESLTALVETHDGTLSIVRWHEAATAAAMLSQTAAATGAPAAVGHCAAWTSDGAHCLTLATEPQQRSDPRVCCASSSSAMPGHRRSASSSRCATRSARSSDWATLSARSRPTLYDDSCPTYPEIRLSLFPGRRVSSTRLRPRPCISPRKGRWDSPRGGIAAQTLSLHHGISHAVSRVRLRALAFAVDFTYRWMRWFHAPAKALMVATRTSGGGLPNADSRISPCGRAAWTPSSSIPWRAIVAAHRPIFLRRARGRREEHRSISHARPCPGPSGGGRWSGSPRIERRFTNARFLGTKTGEDLAWHFRQADVFVFPSRTDTFGLVMLEAMACGTPVAAFPVTGPIDVVEPGVSGVLDADLRVAALAALALPRDAVRAHALSSSWGRATAQFLENLHPFHARG